MNLLDHNNVRQFRTVIGSITGQQILPCWSAPQAKIIEGSSSVLVAQNVSKLLANEDIHVCAVSPAAISMAGAGVETYSWTAVTVIYQERLPAASLLADRVKDAA